MPRGQQNPHHPGFVAGDEPLDCGACIRHHNALTGAPAELEPENWPAWRLYGLAQSQVRAAMEVIGIDLLVLPMLLDLYRIPRDDWRQTVEKVVVIDEEHRRQREADARRQREQDAVRREA